MIGQKIITIDPHPGQRRVLNERKRINKLNCARRWGKTTLGTGLLLEATEDPYPVAWFAPSYKDLSEVWRKIKRALMKAGMVAEKNEQLKEIHLVTGGRIDFWSLTDPDSGRGRKYKRVVIDECAKIKHFKEAWEQTIRPTLADYGGDAYMFSTPKGRNNYWYELCSKVGPEDAVFQLPTSDNPYIPRHEIQAAKDELPAAIFQQEFEAKFVDLADGLFLQEWDNRFVLGGENEVEIDPTYPLYLSFDFNVDPTTAILFQVFEEQDGGIFFLDEVQVKGGTARLCEELLIYKDHPGMLYVTGDYSGNTGSTVGGLLPGGEYNTDYSIILDKLDLNEGQLVDTRTVNKRHVLSRGLCNYALKNELVWINERCTQLITDVSTAIPTSSGKLLKDRGFYKNDALDAFRYAIHTQAPEGINSLRQLKQICDG